MPFPSRVGDAVSPFMQALLQSTSQEEQARRQRSQNLYNALLQFGQGVGRQRELRESRTFEAEEAEKRRKHEIGVEGMRQGAEAARVREAADERGRQLTYERTPIDPLFFGEIVPEDLQARRGYRRPTAEEQMRIREQRGRAAPGAVSPLDLAKQDLAERKHGLEVKKHETDQAREARLGRAAEDLAAYRKGRLEYQDKQIRLREQAESRLETAETFAQEQAARKSMENIRSQYATSLRSIEAQRTALNKQLSAEYGYDPTGRLADRLSELDQESAFYNEQIARIDENLGFRDAVEGHVRDLVRAAINAGFADPKEIHAKLLSAAAESPQIKSWLTRSGVIGVARLLREATK